MGRRRRCDGGCPAPPSRSFPDSRCARSACRSPPQNNSPLKTMVGTPNTPSASRFIDDAVCPARAGPRMRAHVIGVIRTRTLSMACPCPIGSLSRSEQSMESYGTVLTFKERMGPGAFKHRGARHLRYRRRISGRHQYGFRIRQRVAFALQSRGCARIVERRDEAGSCL